jgi:neopullulanase
MRTLALIPMTLVSLTLACSPDPAGPGAGKNPGDSDDSGGDGGDDGGGSDCATVFTYRSANADTLTSVHLAGSFNDWDSEAVALEEGEAGVWTVSMDLPAGAHAYKFVELHEWTYDGYEAWVCDPNAELIHCEDGYKEPSDTSFEHTCISGEDSACNSMLIVPTCGVPVASVDTLTIDRDAATVDLVMSLSGGEGAVGAQVRYDDVDVSPQIASGTLTLSLSSVSAGRHTLRVVPVDAEGTEGEEVYIPFWADAGGDDAWRDGLIYFAFVDRFANGDTSIDASEGATLPIGDYQGGDLQGVIDMLDYLDELGVRTLWLSNPQDNAEGGWAGDCAETYAGYHAYWPDQPRAMEEHFGDEDALHRLVDGAHARGMRVVMDWVANHVHEDHPYYAEHADTWFHDQAICKDSVDGVANWDRIPEQCWFAPYLPDIDYSQPDALHTMVDDAVWWAKTYELDGFRVDAVKHMPHSVVWNLEARVRAEIEHTASGGDEQFWTVGETFDSYDRIVEYMHNDSTLGLDGQFDFPLYYTIQAAFGARTASLGELASSAATSRDRYGDALMSSFMGNHDVMRFSTQAAEGWRGACDESSGVTSQAYATSDQGVYLRMKLAWTYLFTQPDVPLVYYGDEFGLPGYSDPDNRQPMWWHTGDMPAGATVDDVIARLDTEPGNMLRHVRALGQARLAHPALWRGDTTEWWVQPAEWPTTWAYARHDTVTGDEAIVIINNEGEGRTLTNGIAYAGLTPGRTYADVLTGETFTADGDSLSVWTPAWSSRVLVGQ